MEEVVAEQRIYLQNLLHIIVQRYGRGKNVLAEFESKPEVDIEILGSIMYLLSTLQEKIETDDELHDIIEHLQDINDKVLKIAEDMKI